MVITLELLLSKCIKMKWIKLNTKNELMESFLRELIQGQGQVTVLNDDDQIKLVFLSSVT